MFAVNINDHLPQTSTYEELSTKKALLVGINYRGTASQLSGCINDIINMEKELIDNFGYKSSDIVVLSENGVLPTKKNTLDALGNLVVSAKAGDSLLFAFSGHGDTCPDFNGDEETGYDETLVPLDYRTCGEIVDDDLKKMINLLPAGCNFTMICDSCHSGTVLDLPHVYRSGENNLVKMDHINEKKFFSPEEQDTKANIFLFSGCKDEQTSADAYEDGLAQGAMSWALHKALKANNYQVTYDKLLRDMRTILRERRYPQIVSLSTGKQITGREMVSL